MGSGPRRGGSRRRGFCEGGGGGDKGKGDPLFVGGRGLAAKKGEAKAG